MDYHPHYIEEMEMQANAHFSYIEELRAEHEDHALDDEAEWQELDAVGLGGTKYGTPPYLGKFMWYECGDDRFDTDLPF